MIYDIITYNGEEELFEIRYNILKDVVDEFRVIEFDQTFSGKPREKVFTQNWEKVKSYFVSKDTWEKYRESAIASPNTQYGKGAQHWVREFCQKESIKDCLTDLQSEDVLFIGDCDEIWERPKIYPSYPQLCHLKVYSYWLNNRSSEDFWGILKINKGYLDELLKSRSLNEIRTTAFRESGLYGWHFTSIGGHEKVTKKLTDSYTSDSYASPVVLDNLKQNIENNKDFLGRNFTYQIDEEHWPQYLKDNKDKYKHLCL